MKTTAAIRDMPDGASFVSTPSFTLAQTVATLAARQRATSRGSSATPAPASVSGLTWW